MKRAVLALAAALTLSACGVGGPPERPERADRPQPGVRVSGEATMGAVFGL